MANDERMIVEVTRIGDLYDFYAPLLTERQRRMVELHYLDDWSLGEISDHFQVSRQAVHDNLRRAKEQMDGYEGLLHLVANHLSFTKRTEYLLTIWREIRDLLPQEQKIRMDKALNDLLGDESLLTGRDTHA